MSESFRCGDEGALVAYLYDECEPAERSVVAAHLTSCATCTEQVEQWSWTREQVRAWAPPEAALGFQITARDAAVTPRLVGDQPRATVSWWRAPLPAWAQAAAAVLVFGAGLSVGLAREEAGPVPEAAPATAASPVAAGVAASDLAALEARLRAEFNANTASTPAPAGPVTAAALTDAARADLLREVSAIVDESVVQQNIDVTERQLDFERRLETQRRADRDQFVEYRNAASQEIRQHREMIDLLQRVSLPGR